MKKAILFAVLVVALVLALAGYVLYANKPLTAPQEEKEYTSYAPGGAKITEVDLASDPVSKLPPGFPETIPVEKTIVESLRKVYEEYSLTQYAVNSISERSFDAIWQDYTGFLNSAGYVVKVSDKTEGVMEGERGGSKLTVYISPRDLKSFVTLYYVERH